MKCKVYAYNQLKNSSSLTLIKIPLEQFENQKNRNEIWFDGKLYDVVTFEVKGELAYVTVFNDKQEEAIVCSMSRLQGSGINIDTNSENYFAKGGTDFMQGDWLLPEQFLLKKVFGTELSSRYRLIPKRGISNYIADVIKPPPQNVLI